MSTFFIDFYNSYEYVFKNKEIDYIERSYDRAYNLEHYPGYDLALLAIALMLVLVNPAIDLINYYFNNGTMPSFSMLVVFIVYHLWTVKYNRLQTYKASIIDTFNLLGLMIVNKLSINIHTNNDKYFIENTSLKEYLEESSTYIAKEVFFSARLIELMFVLLLMALCIHLKYPWYAMAASIYAYRFLLFYTTIKNINKTMLSNIFIIIKTHNDFKDDIDDTVST